MRIGLELLAHVGNRPEEISAGAVHLVDEGNARHAVLVGLAPDRLGLGLHAGHGTENRDGAVEHTHGALHLGGEVNVPGSVDDIDALLDALPRTPRGIPGAGNGGGSDRDATLTLLLHPVGDRGALVNFAHLVDGAGVEKDTLGRGRLARINVRGDANVARPLEGKRAVLGVGRGNLRFLGDDGDVGHSDGHGRPYQRRWAKARFA